MNRSRAAVRCSTQERHGRILDEDTLECQQADPAGTIEIADDVGMTPAQVALAWQLHHPDVTAPIVGASTVEQLEENLGAADVSLSPEQFERLSAAKLASPE